MRDGIESQSLLKKSASKSCHCSLSRSVRTLRDTDRTWYLSFVLLSNSSHACSMGDKSGKRAGHGSVCTLLVLEVLVHYSRIDIRRPMRSCVIILKCESLCHYKKIHNWQHDLFQVAITWQRTIDDDKFVCFLSYQICPQDVMTPFQMV